MVSTSSLLICLALPPLLGDWAWYSGSLENGGADMLLMTGNTRSGGVSQGRPEGAAPARGAQRRALTDAVAEGT
jgi:hypothetical protein